MPVIKRLTLTKTIVEGVKPRAQAYRLWDAKVPGLALRVLPSGRSTYEVHWPRNRAQTIGVNGVMTLAGARSAATRVLGEIEQHGVPLKPSARVRTDTFGEYLDKRYVPHIETVNKAGKADAAALRANFSHLSGRSLKSITKADFDDFVKERLAAGSKPATVNRDMDRFKAALSQAVEWGLITTNPMSGVKRLVKGIEQRVRYLTEDEEEALIQALVAREEAAKERRERGNQWRATRRQDALPTFDGYSDCLLPMVMVAWGTGMRRGELTSLHWDDINFANRVVTVRAGYAKSGKARHIPLNSDVIEILRKHKRDSSSGKVFPLKSVSSSFKAVLAAAGITDFRFHDLRHSFASRLVMKGVPLNTVRELMGHGDMSMTLRYAHLAPSHKSDAVERLATGRRL